MSLQEAIISPQPQLSNFPLLAFGMHGLGDSLHLRACLRQWLDHGLDVYLESSWVSIFDDLVDRGLKVIRKSTPLRTQNKNAKRESSRFHIGTVPNRRIVRRIATPPDMIRKHGNVLAAMCAVTGCDYAKADFRMQVKADWCGDVAPFLVNFNGKPIMIYRPPCIRPEWGGHQARNPDPLAYAELFRHLRQRFFVISIADFENGREWLAGPDLSAECDVVCHRGELTTENLLALFSLASLVFTTGGFAVIMAQTVQTPVIAAMGGYEDSRSYLGGARHSLYLGIDTIKPCQCFSHNHACEKRIDIPAAKTKIDKFLADHEI